MAIETLVTQLQAAKSSAGKSSAALTPRQAEQLAEVETQARATARAAAHWSRAHAPLVAAYMK